MNIDPRVIPTAYGMYLAVSRKGDDPAIGVMGDTEDEARLRFAEAVDRRLELRRGLCRCGKRTDHA